MQQLDVVEFGEAMAMFIADEYLPLDEANHYTRAIAGAELNVAVGLKRLGFRVGWISRLGADPLGRYILHQVQQWRLDTTRVLFDEEQPTGFQLKSRVREGDPVVNYFRKGSAASHMAPNAEDDTYLRTSRHLHVTGIPPALSASCRQYTYHMIEQAHDAGLSISFDPNLRPTLWKSEDEMRQVINDLATRTDWVFPGLIEATMLTGYTQPEDIAHFYLDRGAKLVALKMGAEGSYLFTASQRYYVPSFPVSVVDTVGAGDGFAVGVISGMLEGLDLPLCLERGNAIAALAITVAGDNEVPLCLERGNAIAALAITVAGDNEGLPDREILHHFLHTHRNANIVQEP